MSRVRGLLASSTCLDGSYGASKSNSCHRRGWGSPDNKLDTYLVPNKEASKEIPNAKKETGDDACYRKIWCSIYYHDPCKKHVRHVNDFI